MQVRVLLGAGQREVARLVDLAVRRARFALRRLTAFNPKVHVELSDIDPPRPEGRKRCRVRLDTDASQTVFATAWADEWRVAVDQALARAVRRLLGALRRATELRLGSIPTRRLSAIEATRVAGPRGRRR
jgi:hypothetical protein